MLILNINIERSIHCNKQYNTLNTTKGKEKTATNGVKSDINRIASCRTKKAFYLIDTSFASTPWQSRQSGSIEFFKIQRKGTVS